MIKCESNREIMCREGRDSKWGIVILVFNGRGGGERRARFIFFGRDSTVHWRSFWEASWPRKGRTALCFGQLYFLKRRFEVVPRGGNVTQPAARSYPLPLLLLGSTSASTCVGHICHRKLTFPTSLPLLPYITFLTHFAPGENRADRSLGQHFHPCELYIFTLSRDIDKIVDASVYLSPRKLDAFANYTYLVWTGAFAFNIIYKHVRRWRGNVTVVVAVGIIINGNSINGNGEKENKSIDKFDDLFGRL